MCRLFGIEKKTRTTALHPEGDVMVERVNSTAEAMLFIFVNKNQRDWNLYLPLLRGPCMVL